MILNPYIFPKEPNTFIGNAGATLSTKALLASRLTGVTASNIHSFHIDANNNISCHISKKYGLINGAFRQSSVPGISYFLDLEGKCLLGTDNGFRGNISNVIILPNFETCVYNYFAQSPTIELISIPNMIPIGFTTGGDSTFLSASFATESNVYVNIANETINGGNPDGDITGAVVSKIKYSSNSNSPTEAENLVASNIFDDEFDLEWDAISHSNAIDWYLVFANGVYKGKTVSTTMTVSGLSAETDYEIKILAIDEMGNNSRFSEVLTVTTAL